MTNWVVILAGGSGTRLWPLSRRRLPKQFLPLLPGDETLLAATARRCSSIVPGERVLVVTAASQVEEVRRALPWLPSENVVAEPLARNTAPCIGLAALAVRARDPDGVMAVLPSDQAVRDERAFIAAVQQALVTAAAGEVVTLGIHPTRPETGFGYIHCGPPSEQQPWARRVLRFVEKPDHATALGYLASGEYLWNAGMFFFSAARILDEIGRHMPDLGRILDTIAADPAQVDSLYPTAPRISIDYGVMEKLPGAMYVVPADIGWSDVGSWAALPEVRPPDSDGNTVVGEAIAIDARGNVLVGDGRIVVAAVGVSDLVIIATADAVLVLPKERAQDVKKIVEALEAARRDPYL
ncbi:MAG: mannose-1-phosphate guanylyltransferase [Myxococcales bacterium]|nr:mannose-1-phosphate guanylyltransferase [Myxococcales bacterium]